MRTLIIGCGYIGRWLALEMSRQGHSVTCLRRSAIEDEGLHIAGIEVIPLDVSRTSSWHKLEPLFDWVVNCASSNRGGEESYRAVYLEGTRNLLNWLASAPPRKYVYTSSTGIYAQNDGSWVDESAETAPASETGKILLQTENLLREAHDRSGFPAIILRVAGIYGPGRTFLLKNFLAGEAVIEGRGDRHLNMVRREDVVGAIRAALERGQPGEIFNVADGEPVRQGEFYQWLAERLRRPLPPSVETAEPPSRKRSATNKRIANARLREQLGYGFRFPTYRAGYESLIADLERV